MDEFSFGLFWSNITIMLRKAQTELGNFQKSFSM